MKRYLLLTITAFTFAGCGGGGPGDTAANADDPATDEAPSTADRALDELERRYDDLQQRFDDLTGDELDAPVEWAAEDLENIGDWEYRVVEVDRLSAEELEAALNELGNERWEVIWIDDSLSGRTIILKRPSISLLSKLPLSALGRRLLRDSGGQ